MGGLVSHFVKFAHPSSGSVNAALFHFTRQQLPRPERGVQLGQVAIVLLEEIHHVLVGDINVWVSTKASVFFNGGLTPGKRPLNFLLNRGEVVPKKQGGFGLTAAHFVPRHADSEMVVG